MNINQYLDAVNKLYQSGISSEHAYRPDLRDLINELVSDITITNEPSNVTDCGNPDYVITKGKIPVGFIEAKDVGKDLNSKQYKEQFGRYRKALDNLIITDYIWFQFFQNGELIHEIRIAEISGKNIDPIADNYDEFINLIKDFCSYVSQTIKSPKRLAELMAAKARLLENILEKAIISDEETDDNSALQQQYKTFKDILIHDLTPQGFADIYSQTLAYGMFAARLHDDTLEDFSRQEAAELIPKSNPFLRKLFNHVAGVDIDERIKTTVDNLADVFRATNIEMLLENFGKRTQTHDPIIHFYETFLGEYDPKLRKARGVWYTPEPVVNFIVRSVDEILKSEFSLKDGLADTSKIIIQEKTHKIDGRTKSGLKKIEREVHKVQILDPATGTGTFLAEVVKFIYNEKFISMQGIWNKYVDEDLIPRLNGFELLMASYSMAHLKLDMLLSDTGYKSKYNKRFNIYLTNSLEEHHPDTGTLFSSWLSKEADEANHIKRDSPIMLVMGNPPYSGESANKGAWIMELMDDYKKEPGGMVKLNERNPKWINDDYVKFIRYGQHYIEKNGEGVLAFINSNGFLDNPTFRGMRWNLLKTYDKIYILDLHGSSKKKETAPDGSVDTNVFDIQQGVSINFFIKTGKKNKEKLADVFHYDLYGQRNEKYQYLWEHSIDSVPFLKLPNVAPMYFMVHKDFEAESHYKKGFLLTELFPINSVGIVTARDKFTIHHSFEGIKRTVENFLELGDEEARTKFNLGKDVRDWKVSFARKDLMNTGPNFSNITSISYRPFDNRYTYYTGNSKGFHCYPRSEVMNNFINCENIGLTLCKQFKTGNQYVHAFITDKMIESSYVSNRTSEITSSFPLYLCSNTDKQTSISGDETREPNLNNEIIVRFEELLNLNYTPEESDAENAFAPIDVLDYIYAILFSPNYREKYKDFLKSDFPYIPYPKDRDTFFALIKLGGELRELHLLESDVVENYITSYPVDGDNKITRKIAKNDWEFYDTVNQLGRIWINDEQYFDNIPLIAWEFYIGGYQPAQKWLKDRKEREMSFEDVLHYQKIIVSLMETDRIMKEIDKIDFE